MKVIAVSLLFVASAFGRADPKWRPCMVSADQITQIAIECTANCVASCPTCVGCPTCPMCPGVECPEVSCGDCNPTVTPPTCPNRHDCKKCKVWKGLTKCLRCTFTSQ